MTDFDRGEFVRNQTLTIEPCANGSFLIFRREAHRLEANAVPYIAATMAFSNWIDLMDFLRGEFEENSPKKGLTEADMEQLLRNSRMAP